MDMMNLISEAMNKPKPLSDIIRDIHNAHPEINTLQLGYLREEIDRLQFFGIVRFAVDDGTHDLHKANDLILLKG